MIENVVDMPACLGDIKWIGYSSIQISNTIVLMYKKIVVDTFHKVEAKPNIDGASVHVEASKYVDSGVLPLQAHEVDIARFYSDDVKSKDKEELLEWARRQANKTEFTIVTQRSSLINPMFRLVCERSGAHKVPEKKNRSMQQRDQENVELFRKLMAIESGNKPLKPQKESNKAAPILLDTLEKPQQQFEVIAEDEEDSISLYLPQSFGL
ncbi:hypothetical protein MTR_4g051612 [Medicago truncatula]|uniref:Uncharacterized protein n=1 Tax=Medicago truncatula TaxID=3880 RepID=A0A072UJB6_MEDTR|nr:hypothetical protein MTR_4g051612 [Medicago truncatula]